MHGKYKAATFNNQILIYKEGPPGYFIFSSIFPMNFQLNGLATEQVVVVIFSFCEKKWGFSKMGNHSMKLIF